MADLAPGAPVPRPRPTAASRPIAVSISARILMVAGGYTCLGGAVILVAGGAVTTSRSVGVAYVAFGAAQFLAGAMLLRLSAVFCVLGVVLAVVGLVVDVGGIVAGHRWQVVALIGHAFVVFALANSAEAFRRRG